MEEGREQWREKGRKKQGTEHVKGGKREEKEGRQGKTEKSQLEIRREL